MVYLDAMAKTLVARVSRKGRAYKGLMREGRVWARIAPALRPHVRRYLSANPGKLNDLINMCLAQYFDSQAAQDRADAGAHLEKLLGGALNE